MAEVYLRYVGNASLPGIPARDLTKAEVETCGGEAYLLSTKLYERFTATTTMKPKPTANKLRMKGGEENKVEEGE